MNTITMDAAQAPKAGLAHFVIDPKASSFTVQAFVTGILSAMGHNPTIRIASFGGGVDFDPEALEATALCLTIQAASLGVRDDVSDKDRREMERLMRDEVLEVAKYPEIKYEANAIAFAKQDSALFSATLNGNLSFRGVMRPQKVTAQITPLGEMLRAWGNFNLKQSDYQVKPVSMAGGALKLKDELRFDFQMVVRKQQ